MTRRVFFGMDGVIVDFEGHLRAINAKRADVDLEPITGDDLKHHPSAYLDMPPIAGALAGVRSVIGMGFDVWLATKPPTGIAWAYGDKAAWVFHHLPELKRKLIITHDKGMLGGADDFLVDDRPHRANCGAFRGALVQFCGDETHPAASWHVNGWDALLDALREFAPNIERQSPLVTRQTNRCTVDLQTLRERRGWMGDTGTAGQFGPSD